ncbi:MAG TPA: hypothetical protein VG206_13600 [Terriglobia bacterium]|nr:hypothetical protein [Terriglobia bacterium]
MEKRYDLFELPPAGFPEWIDSAGDLSEVTQKMHDPPKPAAGRQYFVRDFYSGTVVAYRDPRGLEIFPRAANQTTQRIR